jgi:hypothetical protein
MAAQQAISTPRGRPAHGSLPASADPASGSGVFTRQSRVLERPAGTRSSSQRNHAAAGRRPGGCQHDSRHSRHQLTAPKASTHRPVAGHSSLTWWRLNPTGLSGPFGRRPRQPALRLESNMRGTDRAQQRHQARKCRHNPDCCNPPHRSHLLTPSMSCHIPCQPAELSRLLAH